MRRDGHKKRNKPSTVMDTDTKEIVFDEDAYVWTPYKGSRVTEDGLLVYMTKEFEEYTYHVMDITKSKEIWKKEHMDYPLNIGETNGRFVEYNYNCGLGGVDRPFYVDNAR